MAFNPSSSKLFEPDLDLESDPPKPAFNPSTAVLFDEFDDDLDAVSKPSDLSLEANQPGNIATGLAALAQGTLGISKSIWETPETVSRMTQPIRQLGEVTRFRMPSFAIGSAIGEIAEGISPATGKVAERIGEAQEFLGEEFAPFKEVRRLGQEANQAVKDAFDGDPSKLADVMTNPKAWMAFTSNAAPSLYLAYKSGGSLAFISWLEGMESAGGALDFERRTGTKVTDQEFSQAVMQSAMINGLLERFGLRKVMKSWKTSTGSTKEAIGRLLARVGNVVSAGGWEGITELGQQLNTNLSEYLNFNPDKDILEDALPSFMGGFGAGTGASIGGQVLQKVEPPPSTPSPTADIIGKEERAEIIDTITAQPDVDSAINAADEILDTPIEVPAAPPVIDQKSSALEDLQHFSAQNLREGAAIAVDSDVGRLFDRKLTAAREAGATEEEINTAIKREPVLEVAPEPEVPLVSPVDQEIRGLMQDRQEPTQFQPETAQLIPEEEAPPTKKTRAQADQERRQKQLIVRPQEDDLMTAIAKLGGLDSTEAGKRGVDPAYFKDRKGVAYPMFGRPGFRKKGGKTYDDMAGLLSPLGYTSEDYSPNELDDLLDRALAGEKVYSRQVSGDRLMQEKEQDLEDRYAQAFTGDQLDEAEYTDGLEPDEPPLDQAERRMREAHAEIKGFGDEAEDRVIGILEKAETDSDAARQLLTLVEELRRGKQAKTGRQVAQDRQGDLPPARQAQEIPTEEPAPEVTPPAGQPDFFGGKTPTQQAVKDADEARKRAMAEAPPVETVEGDLFSGRARQTDIEDQIKKASPIFIRKRTAKEVGRTAQSRALAAMQEEAPEGFEAVYKPYGPDGEKEGRGFYYSAKEAEPEYTVSYEIQDRKGEVVAEPEGRDVQPSAPVQGTLDYFTEKGEKAPSTFRKRRLNKVEPVRTGTFYIGIDRVETPQDAAHVAAPLRKFAQENFVSLVLDKNRKPIAVLRHHIGTIDGTMVIPRDVLGAVHSMKGARHAWLVHNHPSGETDPSRADRIITDKLISGFEDTGVTYEGHIIVGPGGRATLLGKDPDADTPVDIRPLQRRKLIGVFDRMFRRIGERTPMVMSDKWAKEAIQETSDGKDGIMLLDNRHRVVGFVPAQAAELIKLRTGEKGTGASRLYRAISEANAAAMIVTFNKSEKETDAAVNNLARFSKYFGTRLLDAFVEGEPTGIMPSGEGAFFSRRTGGFMSRKGGKSRVTETSKQFTQAISKYFGRELPADTFREVALPDSVAATLKRVGKAFRKQIVVVRTDRTDLNFNAAVVPGIKDKIFISDTADQPALALFGHELVHYLHIEHPDLYKILHDVAKEELQGIEEYRVWLDNRMKAEGKGPASQALLEEEMIADFADSQFVEPEFWRKVAERNPSKFRQLLDAITAFINRLVKRMKLNGLRGTNYIRDIERVQNVLADVMAEYAARGEQVLFSRQKYPLKHAIEQRAALRGKKEEEEFRLTPELTHEEERILELEAELAEIKTAKDILQRRRGFVRAARDYFGLTDAELKKITRKDIRLMDNFEFKKYIDSIRVESEKFDEKRKATNELELLRKEKEFIAENNIRLFHELPTIKEMSTEQLRAYTEILSGYEKGDQFYTPKRIGRLEGSVWKGAKTYRDVLEKASKDFGIPMENLVKIHVSEGDRFRFATPLARRNSYYQFMIDSIQTAEIKNLAKYFEVKNELFRLGKLALKSRGRGIVARLIPRQPEIMAYAEASGDARIEAAKKLTKEEIALAEYVQVFMSKAYSHLLVNHDLNTSRFEDIYIMHAKKPLSELLIDIPDTGIKSATKDLMNRWRLDEQHFRILDSKTGEILSMKKFFRQTLYRTGELIPSKNIIKTTDNYMRMFFRKMALDESVVAVESLGMALRPKETTQTGVLLNDSLMTFVKEFLNNKKGRTITVPSIQQGGRIDLVIRFVGKIISLRYIALNIPLQVAAIVGETTGKYVGVGKIKLAKANLRRLTPQGRKILKRYKHFTGEGVLEELFQPGRNVGENLNLTFYGILMWLRKSTKQDIILANMTKAEFKAGEISAERLAVLQREMGRWIDIEGSRSIVGSTSVGAGITKFRGWAIPIASSTLHNATSLLRTLTRVGDPAKRLNAKQAWELYRIAEIGALVVTVLALSDDEDRDTFLGNLKFYAIRDLSTVFNAVSLRTVLTFGITVDFLNKFVSNLSLLITMERYKTTGDLKGLQKLKTQFTPAPILQIQKSMGGDDLVEFNKARKKVYSADRRYKELLETDRSEAMEFNVDTKRIRNLAYLFRKTSRELSHLRKRKDRIQASDKYSDQRKKELITRIDEMMSRMARKQTERFRKRNE